VKRTAVATDFETFREAARPLVAAGVSPAELEWRDPADPQVSLFGEQVDTSAPQHAAAPSGTQPPTPRVPRRYVELAETAALYRCPDRFSLLYRVLYRLTHGEPHLLDDAADDDVRTLNLRSQSVWQDEHRMHAFVRFRKVELEGEERFIAWYSPEHHTLRLVAPFFQRRLGNMHWSILTPDESAHWDGETLQFGPGAPRTQAPAEDELEELYRTYYGATYNPARANLPLFRKHIPPAFARHMPELDRMPALMQAGVNAARSKPDQGSDGETAAPLVPPHADLATLHEAAKACLACPAGELGGQTVFGEGRPDAQLCLVGEQPGDEEDRRGRPFVGPAGQVLDRALAEAQVPRDELYVTNAVKHFSFVYRGKRRIHSKPSLRVVRACKPWLEAELKAVQPDVILCLGATAAQSFLGPRFSVTRNRGRVFETPWAKAFIVTYHPSAILRMEDGPAAQAYTELVADLKLAHHIATGNALEGSHLAQPET
jgi:DNA polymerase